MSPTLPFKHAQLALPVASALTLSSPVMALTKLNGITIDGVDKGVLQDASLDVGTDSSVIVIKSPRSTGGQPVVVSGDSSLNLKGSDITIDGEWNRYGVDVFIYDGTAGNAAIGTKNTRTLNISGQKIALSNRSGTVNLDAKHITLSTTKGGESVGTIEMWGNTTEGGADTTIGEHAETVNVIAQQVPGTYVANGSAIRVLNGGTLTIGNDAAQVDINSTFNGASFGIYAEGALPASNDVTVSGRDIGITSHGKQSSCGAFANSNANISIGEAGLSDVTIRSENDEGGSYVYGVWVSKSPKHTTPGGTMTIRGRSVDIAAEGVGDVVGIFVATNTLDENVTRSSLLIEADNILVKADSKDGATPAIGIAAMSRGEVILNGNTSVTADQALLARGDASIRINEEGRFSTQLTGDIVFDYDGATSGTGVNADVRVTLDGADSFWTGNTVVAWNDLKEDASADKLTVTDMRLTLRDGARWTPTFVEGSDPQAVKGQRGVALNDLTLDGGVVNITDESVDVVVERLSGTGTVRLAADLTAEGDKKAGTFNALDASDDASLTVRLTNANMSKDLTADDVTAEEAKTFLGNVSGEALETTLRVDEGMYNGGFDVAEDGTTLTHGENSVMRSTLELASAAPLALNRILTNDVRKRMGDIRSMPSTSGVWARYDGGKLSGKKGLENDFHTIQAGVDTVPAADAPRFGLSFAYTMGDADHARGEAEMDAYSLAAYGLWMGEAGQFLDVVARLGTAKTDMTVDGGKKGSTDTVVTALSGEFGWRFDLSKSFYAEPQVELAYTHVDADTLSLSDGSSYRFDDAESLTARAGLALGLRCPENGNTAYVRVSAVHEFLGDAAVTGGNGTVIETDGKDTWVEYGFGANFNLTDSTYVWADVERTSGGVLDEDYRATVGVRHAF